MIESIVKAFYSIIVNLTGLLYNWICDLFEIFYVLCGIQLFSDNDYNNIVQKIYVILGLVMMFVLIYSLLLAVIDPDKYAKGDNSFPKLIQNVIVSLIIIVVLPTVFNAAFSFQNSLLKYEVIPKLILGDTSDLVKVEGINDPDTISMPKMNVDGVEASGGRAVAFYTFKTFLTYDMNNDDNKCESDYETCRDAVTAEKASITVADVDSAVLASSRDFSHYSMFSGALYDGQLKFDFFISIAAGIFIIYVLLNFCFDMALRVIKLAFYQIIAPIPVICRILPGGKFKDVFSKWVKQVISLFIEVFVRILAITMGVYLIALIADKWDKGFPGIEVLDPLPKQIVLALLIMSVVMFIKQIPKIIGDLFGLDTGGMKLGLMDKLAAGGGLMAASVAGAGADMFLKNGVNAVKNFHDTKGQKFGTRAKAFAAGVGSTLAGTVSGQVRAGIGSRKAKNFGDVKKAVVSASDAATAKREKRSNYSAQHGGVAGSIWGHITDSVTSVGEHFGIESGFKALQEEQNVYKEGMGFKKKLFDLVSDNKNVLAYQGMKEAAQKRDISEYIKSFEDDINKQGFTNRDQTGYYKINSITGQKEYYKDSSGNVVSDFTYSAIEKKAAEIDKYDNAIKLASLQAIQDKINKGDERVTAIFSEFETWQGQHASMDSIADLNALGGLNASQMSAITAALKTNNSNDIKQVLDAFEGDALAMSALNIDSLAVMANDKQFKILEGNVENRIAKKMEEKKNE